MDVNTFFKNGDVSYPTLNADGAFRLRPNNAFVDEKYFEAVGISTGLDSRGTEAYRDVFSGWKKSYENDCAKISEYFEKAKKKLDEAKLKSIGSSGEARVAKTYVVGFQKAHDELQSLMDTANCNIIGKDWTKGEELPENDSKGIGTFGTIAIIGGSAILLGILSYYLYKKYAK
jgi:hypothetical protein